jgi:hypothetical protein
VLGVVIAAIFLTGRGRVTQAVPVPNPQQAPVVNAPGVPGLPQPSVLNTDVEKPPLKPDEKPQPPADVIAYLEHLKRVEKYRQDLCAKELNDLIAMAPQMISKVYDFDEDVDPKSPTNDLYSQASKYSQEWQQIAAYFASVPPPQACNQLAGKYYESLIEFIKFMNSFRGAIAKSDVAQLKNIQRDQTSVDEKLTASDQELAKVCNQFGIDKTFSIQGDTGRTPLLGF